jgi:hypothetical protein
LRRRASGWPRRAPVPPGGKTLPQDVELGSEGNEERIRR